MAPIPSRKMFVNLPVRDLDAAAGFFRELGFSFDARFTDEKATCMLVGEDSYVMLLREEFFKTFTDRQLCDTSRASEGLFAVSCASRMEVDELVERAVAAGGRHAMPPQDHGFMYAKSFRDLDGHHWEVLWMDPETADGTPVVEAASPCGTGEMPPHMQRTPEHEWLQRSAGTWNATIHAVSPDGQQVRSKGTLVSKKHGAFHTIDSFRGEVMGGGYAGHGVNSWCPVRKQFRSIWTDTMSGSPLWLTGDYDQASGLLTMTGEAFGMTGAFEPCRTTMHFVDDDHRSWNFYGAGRDGTEMHWMRIEYERQR